MAFVISEATETVLTSAAGQVVDLPSGRVDTDLLVMHWTLSLNDTSPEPGNGNDQEADGWTYLGEAHSSGKMFIWVAPSRDIASAPVIDLITVGVAHVFRISGTDLDLPVDAFSIVQANANASTSAPQAPSISPSLTNTLLLCFVGNDAPPTSNVGFTPPSGMTELYEGFESTQAINHSAASEALSSAGATGVRTFATTVTDQYLTASLVIAPFVLRPTRFVVAA